MKKSISLLFFLSIFLTTPMVWASSSVKIIPVQAEQSFVIENIGTSLVPANLQIAMALGTESLTNLETQYDLSSTETSGSHYARLIIYKDPKDLGLVGSLLDLVDFKPQLVSMLSDMGKNMISKQMEEHGLKLIEWLPVNKIIIQKHNGIAMAARFTLSEKFPIPMYASVAVYPQNNKLTGLALLCPDSDQAYWQPIFSQLITNLK